MILFQLHQHRNILFFTKEKIVKDGKKNGSGKEYDNVGNLEYEGEFKDGQKNGFDKEYDKDKLVYEGEYL
jgi:antitoxin component YwqK of YwqJK toxin-antitoxin module